jgi:hypothetical protein
MVASILCTAALSASFDLEAAPAVQSQATLSANPAATFSASNSNSHSEPGEHNPAKIAVSLVGWPNITGLTVLADGAALPHRMERTISIDAAS